MYRIEIEKARVLERVLSIQIYVSVLFVTYTFLSVHSLHHSLN